MLTLWGRSPKIGCGPVTLKFRFIHRIIGGVFNKGASAGAGAKETEQAVVLVARDRVSSQSPYSQLTMPVTATVTALRLRLHSVTARAERRYVSNEIEEWRY